LNFLNLSCINFAEITVTEGDPINLTCTLKGSNISWIRIKEHLHTGRRYFKGNITRNESGNYKCHDSNNLSETYMVIVQCMYSIGMPLRIINF